MKKLLFVITFVLILFSCASCDKLFIPGNVPDKPPALTVSSEAGERTSEPLNYYWEKRKTGEKSEQTGYDPFSIEYDPLVVQPGEEMRFTFADGNNPWIMNIEFSQADGNGGYREAVTLSHKEGEELLYPAPEEDGILVVNALWPVWVNTGIRAEVTYAFYIWSAKG